MANRFSGSFRNWLRGSDLPEQLPQTLERLERSPDPRPFIVPEDSDVQEGAIRVSRPRLQARPKENYTPDGTYIPLGGGLRGWYDNSGVMNCETPNRYRFREAVNADAFKRTILERIDSFNRRGGDRYQVNLWVKYSHLPGPELEGSHRAYCLDLSSGGAKLRARRAIDPGQRLSISFFQQKADLEQDQPLTTVHGLVAYCKPAGGRSDSPRFYLGVKFVDLEIGAKQTLAVLMSPGRGLVPVSE
jgi:hypothetical protein